MPTRAEEDRFAQLEEADEQQSARMASMGGRRLLRGHGLLQSDARALAVDHRILHQLTDDLGFVNGGGFMSSSVTQL